MTLAILRCHKVGLVKKGQQILADLSFAVEPGEIIGIAGPSGAGKSSLLRLLNLLHSPTDGQIYYKEQDLLTLDPQRLRREIGYVLQKPYLFEGTVRDNLEYPYRIGGQEPDSKEIQAYLARVKLTPTYLTKRGSELSGGEQQRIALVRSLLAKPTVLLLDEVSSALDEENTLNLEQLIRQEQQVRTLTVLLISHNADQLRRLADRVLYLKQGRLDFFGPVAEYVRRQGGDKDE